MNQMLKCSMLTLLLLAIGCSSSGGDDPEVVEPSFQQKVQQEVDNQNLPQLMVTFVKPTGETRNHAFAGAQFSVSQPSSDSVFLLASVSKLFVATAVMTLVDKGALALSQPVQDFLPFPFFHPSFPDQPITVEHLLIHRSGLGQDGNFDFVVQGFPSDQVPDFLEWMPDFFDPESPSYASDTWTEFSPGEKPIYSNLGPTVLALLVEQVSDQPYWEYCQENIFGPLDMFQTGFFDFDSDRVNWVEPFSIEGDP